MSQKNVLAELIAGFFETFADLVADKVAERINLDDLRAAVAAQNQAPVDVKEKATEKAKKEEATASEPEPETDDKKAPVKKTTAKNKAPAKSKKAAEIDPEQKEKVSNYLEWLGDEKGAPERVDELLEEFDVTSAEDVPAESYGEFFTKLRELTSEYFGLSDDQ